MAAFTFTIGRKKYSASNVVITGAMLAPRSAIVAAIEKAGGHVQSSVSSTTELVIVGYRPGKAKIKRAIELGIPGVVSELLVEVMGIGLAPKDPDVVAALRQESPRTKRTSHASGDRAKWAERTRELKRTHRKAKPGEESDFTYRGHGWVKKVASRARSRPVTLKEHRKLVRSLQSQVLKPVPKKRTSKKKASKRKTSRRAAPARRTSGAMKKFFWQDSAGNYGTVSASSASDAKKRVTARGKRGVKIKSKAPSWY